MRHPKQSRLWHILPLVVATPWLIVVPVNAKAGASAERASSPASSGLHSVLPTTTTDQIGSFTALADGLVKTPDGMTLQLPARSMPMGWPNTRVSTAELSSVTRVPISQCT